MPNNLQQYRGEIGAFYNHSSKYTFVLHSYEFNNTLVFPLVRTFLCLVYFIVIFFKALKDRCGTMLKLSTVFLHLLISYSLLTQLSYHHVSLNGDIELNFGPK